MHEFSSGVVPRWYPTDGRNENRSTTNATVLGALVNDVRGRRIHELHPRSAVCSEERSILGAIQREYWPITPWFASIEQLREFVGQDQPEDEK